MKPQNTLSESFEHRTHRFVVNQFLILGALVGMSLLNEAVDLPHLIFSSTAASPETRWGEVAIETLAFLVVVLMELSFIQKLRQEIRVLHGLLPVCEHCHRIFSQHKWEPLAHYINTHSMADVHETICPSCLKQETPDTSGNGVTSEPRSWMG